MLEFCPECSNLLRKRIIDGMEYLACGCGYKRELEGQTGNTRFKKIQKQNKPRKLKVKSVSWDPPKAISLYAKIKDAPKGKNKGGRTGKSSIILKMVQDKLDMKYYNCSKCTQLMSANLFCTLHERKVGKSDICKSFEPVYGGLDAKKAGRRSDDWKRGSALKANRKCGKCIFFQKKFCYAHKKKTTGNKEACEQFEYIYERSEELLRKKD
ncbi:hypothetical protein LCGC14_0830560 [marine sediment metagenome]|uniref:Uncharacterized protein n=1 Tax=marine sediment metagenome TaxID=412755 RepID=A0A0F9S0Z3_9ZZZZ|nr:MAG: hypothetical protein Lokiarch_31100 [Candidatus Lokiarchaeum sp. GC14_75]